MADKETPKSSKTDDDVEKDFQKYEAIDPSEHPEPHKLLQKLQKKHKTVEDANIGLAWCHSVKANKDGKLWLGKSQQIAQLDREFNDLDFRVVLNFDAWQKLTPFQREALVDHCLCAFVGDMTEGGDLSYRTRQPDIQAFTENVARYGMWLSDIQQFVQTAQQQLLPFAEKERAEARAQPVGAA